MSIFIQSGMKCWLPFFHVANHSGITCTWCLRASARIMSTSVKSYFPGCASTWFQYTGISTVFTWSYSSAGHSSGSRDGHALEFLVCAASTRYGASSTISA